ncbi:hypothetical protein E2C01_056980 [Portunus trituberculatus]|uniref:Uncharacterized protein n=1 Tax=Portunus trituberculatus TaxID=210409 RepID=A0A5B7GSA2_PORTR|nr:hypothetical protein [Portunus trituberculatus]
MGHDSPPDRTTQVVKLYTLIISTQNCCFASHRKATVPLIPARPAPPTPQVTSATTCRHSL